MPARVSSSSILRKAFLRLVKPSSQVLVPDRIAAGFPGSTTSFTSTGSPEPGTRVGRLAAVAAGALGEGPPGAGAVGAAALGAAALGTAGACALAAGSDGAGAGVGAGGGSGAGLHGG